AEEAPHVHDVRVAQLFDRRRTDRLVPYDELSAVAALRKCAHRQHRAIGGTSGVVRGKSDDVHPPTLPKLHLPGQCLTVFASLDMPPRNRSLAKRAIRSTSGGSCSLRRMPSSNATPPIAAASASRSSPSGS